LPRRAAISERLSTAIKLVPVHVVAGVLNDAAGRVLLAQRPAGKPLSGSWEFPGGKLETDESRLAGLKRELHEEIGVVVEAAHPLMRLVHSYPERDIDLDVWLVTSYRGEARSLDGQRLCWCERAALLHADPLPADRPVVTALRLPERIHASAGPGFRVVAMGAADFKRDGPTLVGALCDGESDAASAAADGADFVVLRHRLDKAEISALCARMNVPLFVHGITLEEAWELGATGVSDLAG
jgi:mutator protein MutT